MNGYQQHPWTVDEHRALQELYYQSQAYRYPARNFEGLTHPQMAHRMTQIGQREGWQPRNYTPLAIALELSDYPELRLPPRTLDPSPRFAFDNDIVRRFRPF